MHGSTYLECIVKSDASTERLSLNLCGDSEYELPYGTVFGGQAAHVFDSAKRWNIQVSWDAKLQRYRLVIEGKEFKELPIVPGS